MRVCFFILFLLFSCSPLVIGQQQPMPKATASAAAQPGVNVSGDDAIAVGAIPVRTYP